MSVRSTVKKSLVTLTVTAATLFGFQAYDVNAASVDQTKDNYGHLNEALENVYYYGCYFDEFSGDSEEDKQDSGKDVEVEETPQTPEQQETPPVSTPEQERPNGEATNENTPEESEAAYALSEFEQQVVELTNVERGKQGLQPLKIDEKLSEVAREKSKDMQSNNYFDHNSPTYGSPFDMMKQFGVTYNAAGENIAQGQRSPEEVVNAWMNSQGHRENILNSDFTHIGVGHVSEGNYWTQQFIGK